MLLFMLFRVDIAPSPPSRSPRSAYLPPPLGQQRKYTTNRVSIPPPPPRSYCFFFLKMEDEDWLEKHSQFGSAATAAAAENSETNNKCLLDEDTFEDMLGILEMATGVFDPIRLSKAEPLFVSKLGMNKVSPSLGASVRRRLSLPRRLSFLGRESASTPRRALALILHVLYRMCVCVCVLLLLQQCY